MNGTLALLAAAICGAYAIPAGSGGIFDLPMALLVLAGGSAAVVIALR